MSAFLSFFSINLIVCLLFTIFCFVIAWPVGLYFRYKDTNKMKEVLRDQPKNNRRYWLVQIGKLSLAIFVLYGLSYLISHFFEMPFSSTAPFVGLLTLLLVLYIKFAPRTTGEVTPDMGGWETTYVIVSPDAYFTSTGVTMIFGSFVFTVFEFVQVLY